MIELTVGLPIWNSKNIAWLCLKSLCKQQGINFEWELIIAEEQIHQVGKEQIAQYVDRLKKVGCVSVRYNALDYHVNLPYKWKLLGEKASQTSEAFVFCSADDYYEPNKLKLAYDKIKAGYDWVGYRYCLYYHIKDRKLIQWDANSINWKPGNISACKTLAIKNLPETEINKGVDKWLFKTIQPSRPFIDSSDNWKNGFATDGMNNISLDRREYYYKPVAPFFKTELTINHIINPDIISGYITAVNKPLISIVTAAWKRHGLLEVFCKYYQDLKKKVDFELIIACSEKEAEDITKKYGHKSVFIANDPLSRKMNFAAKHAYGSDYCVMIGSDDFLTVDYFEYISKQFEKYTDYILPMDWYFFDTKTKAGLYWGGYKEPRNKDKGCGAGRVLSKKLMNELNWEPWGTGMDGILDTAMEVKMSKLKYTKHSFFLKEQGIVCLDVKTSQNMTPFAKWDNTTEVDGMKLLESFKPYKKQFISLCAA